MTSPVSPELSSKITYWRSRSLEGTITIDEMKEAILALRQDRKSAAEASEASGSKRKKAPPKNVDDMLSELNSL